ncbi:MAG: metal-dependent hydrolase [Methanobacteriota archaeon]
MSGYSTHLITYLVIALFTALMLSSYFNSITLIIAVFIGCFYTLLPDVDAPSSKVRRLVGKFFLALVLVLLVGFLGGFLPETSIILSIGFCGFLYFLWYVKHRGILHSVFAGFIFAGPLVFIEPVYAGFAFMGFVLHLVLDGEVFR